MHDDFKIPTHPTLHVGAHKKKHHDASKPCLALTVRFSETTRVLDTRELCQGQGREQDLSPVLRCRKRQVSGGVEAAADGGRGRNQAQLQARAARPLSEADGDAARGGRNGGCSSEVLNTP